MPVDKRERYRQVAALHAASIHQGFLATLGIPFLALMYQAIDEAPDSILLVEERNGRVVGFVSGGTGMGTIYKRMLNHPFRLGWALIPSLLRPERIKRIVDILRYGTRLPGPETGMPRAELLSIAVLPEIRGGGVAQSLYGQLQDHFLARGVPAFRITVGDALLPAHRFYTRMGAVPAGKAEVHPGETSTVYVHNVAGEPRA